MLSWRIRAQDQGGSWSSSTRITSACSEFNGTAISALNEEIAAVQERARTAIRQVAETEKYDLILIEQEVLFRSRRLDITDKIIRSWAINRQHMQQTKVFFLSELVAKLGGELRGADVAISRVPRLIG